MNIPQPNSSEFIRGLLSARIDVPEEALRDEIVSRLVSLIDAGKVDCAAMTELRSKVCSFTGVVSGGDLHPNIVRLDGASIAGRPAFVCRGLTFKMLEYIGINRGNKVDVLGSAGAVKVHAALSSLFSKSMALELLSPMGPGAAQIAMMSGPINVMDIGSRLLGGGDAFLREPLTPPARPSPLVVDDLVSVSHDLLMQLLMAKVPFATVKDAIQLAMAAKGMETQRADFFGATASTHASQASERMASAFLLGIQLDQLLRMPINRRASLTLAALGLDDERGQTLFGDERWSEIAAFLRAPLPWWSRSLRSLRCALTRVLATAKLTSKP